MMRFILFWGFAVWATGAYAEVIDKGPGGFTVRHSIDIAAAPGDVFRIFTGIGDWWDSAHSYSGDARNLTLTLQPGGCFCEKLPGGMVRHLDVIAWADGKSVSMSGGLGPVQFTGSGNLRVTFAGRADGTRVELTYRVWGYDPKGMDALAAPVDMVLGLQTARLKNFAEHGKP